MPFYWELLLFKVDNTRKDVSLMNCSWRLQKVHFILTRIILPLIYSSAPINTKIEQEETCNMAAYIFLVAYCPIINTKLSQLGSVSSRILNVYPCLICR